MKALNWGSGTFQGLFQSPPRPASTWSHGCSFDARCQPMTRPRVRVSLRWPTPGIVSARLVRHHLDVNRGDTSRNTGIRAQGTRVICLLF